MLFHLLALDLAWPALLLGFAAVVVSFVVIFSLFRVWGSNHLNRKSKGKVERYTGQRNKEGRYHGKGRLTYPNGSVYEGNFMSGKPWGRGKATSSNGDSYEGGWKDGKRHNAGEVHYADGSCFVGTFKDGKKHGRGVLTLENLDSVEGHWEAGELVEAVIRSSSYIYEGEVKNFKPHGRGKAIFIMQGTKENAETKSIVDTPLTMKWSEAVKSLADDSGTQGDTYFGSWRNGLFHGHGVYHFCENDSYYEGGFEDNLLHGKGRLTVIHDSDELPEGEQNGEKKVISTFEGIFEYGVPAGFGVYRSWLGSEFKGDLKLLHMEEDGSFSPSKNRAAARESAGKRSRLNSLAESAKKLFMGRGSDEGDDEDEGELGDSGDDGVKKALPAPSVNGVRSQTPPRTPHPTREQRFTKGSPSRKRGDSVSVWEAPLAFMHAHGKGTFIYPNGDKYVGQLSNNLKQGNGKMIYANGNIYEGEFDQDLFHGKGTYTQIIKNQGTKVYRGDFNCGQRSGIGRLVFPSGASYEGQWSRDLYWGTGRYEFSNGDIYSGSFLDGKRDDIGRMEYKNGSVFQGHWKDDKRVKGELTLQNGNVYIGSFNDKNMEGVGRFVWTDGSTYEGGWLQNKASGIGRFTKPGKSGYVYEGGWLDNKKHTGDSGELAIVIYANGDEYVGSFVAGRMTGPGKRTFASGAEEQVGEFLDGTFQGP